MSYLNKEQYDYRRESAAQRMEDNARIESLTEEQHETLAWLCQIRHNIHCNMKVLWNDQNGQHNEYINYIDHVINDRLNSVGLNVIRFDKSDMIPTASDWDADYWGGGWTSYEDAYEYCMNHYYIQHGIIESYLLTIDNEHGTNYCPSGALRV